MLEKYIPGTYVVQLRLGEGLVLPNIHIEVFSSRPFPSDKIIVGFMGSAGKERDLSGNELEITGDDKDLGKRIGEIIESYGAIISNGAVWGPPYFVVRGGHKDGKGSYTFGISPYPNKEEHGPRNPIKHFDLIVYGGVNCGIQQNADFTFRDWFNTLHTDITMSAGGRLGTPDECMHVLEQGGIYIPIRGTGGATDWLIEGIERGVFNKNTGSIVIIADKTQASLENAISEGVNAAKRRWEKEGRTQNRFSYVADKLEEVMGVK